MVKPTQLISFADASRETTVERFFTPFVSSREAPATNPQIVEVRSGELAPGLVGSGVGEAIGVPWYGSLTSRATSPPFIFRSMDGNGLKQLGLDEALDQ